MGKKEEEYEVIEGGDDDSEDDIGYSESKGGQEKIDSLDTEEEMEDEDISSQKEKPPEELRFKDGDDEWDKDQKDADLDDSEEKEEVKEVEKEVEKEEVEEEKKELSEEEKQDKKAQEEMIKYLSEEEGGGTKYRVKGKDYDLRDLSPEEWRQRHSLAGRAYQVMEEAAEQRKQIDIEKRDMNEATRRNQDFVNRYGESKSGETTKVPDILKPDDMDSDEVKSLKEMNANLYNRVDKLESDGEQQGMEAQRQDLHRQLDSLEKEFPMVSKSEVIAVKSMPEFANADIRVIAENSHNNRVSDEYLEAVKKARPEYFRELDEKAIEKHLKKNPKVRKVSRKTSSTVASKKISSGKKDAPRNWDEIEARDGEFKRGLDEAREEDE